MSWADAVNGAFEAGAILALLLNCRRLQADKQVRGVSMVAVGFFTSWGVWNLYYYQSLGQTLSFVAGIGVVASNLLWLGLVVYYTRRKA